MSISVPVTSATAPELDDEEPVELLLEDELDEDAAPEELALDAELAEELVEEVDEAVDEEDELDAPPDEDEAPLEELDEAAPDEAAVDEDEAPLVEEDEAASPDEDALEELPGAPPPELDEAASPEEDELDALPGSPPPELDVVSTTPELDEPPGAPPPPELDELVLCEPELEVLVLVVWTVEPPQAASATKARGVRGESERMVVQPYAKAPAPRRAKKAASPVPSRLEPLGCDRDRDGSARDPIEVGFDRSRSRSDRS